MQYLVIERFHPGKVKSLYQRFDEQGRMLPEGVFYINSWIDETVTCCFQLMETDIYDKLSQWISYWDDLADFEVIPVLSSAQAREKVMGA